MLARARVSLPTARRAVAQLSASSGLEHSLRQLQRQVGNHAMAAWLGSLHDVQRADYGGDDLPTEREKDSERIRQAATPHPGGRRRGPDSLEIDGDLVTGGLARVGGSATIGNSIASAKFVGNHVTTRVVSGAEIRVVGNVTATEQVVLQGATVVIGGRTVSRRIKKLGSGQDLAEVAPEAANDLVAAQENDAVDGAGGPAAADSGGGPAAAEPGGGPAAEESGSAHYMDSVDLPGSLTVSGRLSSPLVRVGGTTRAGLAVVAPSNIGSLSGTSVVLAGERIVIGGAVVAPLLVVAQNA